MKNQNLVKCNICNLAIISEELGVHKCIKSASILIIDGQSFLLDGIRSYPLKPTNRQLTGEKSNSEVNRTLDVNILTICQRDGMIF